MGLRAQEAALTRAQILTQGVDQHLVAGLVPEGDPVPPLDPVGEFRTHDLLHDPADVAEPDLARAAGHLSFLRALRDRISATALLRTAIDRLAAAHAWRLSDPWGQSEANVERLLELVVDSALLALQRLAAWHRSERLGKVLAITGSNGKTVVKNALTRLLAGRPRVSASPGSYNSQIGLPLAVLEADDDSELTIIEAGISEPGEMRVLEQIARPDLGILTNVGLAHLAAFGSRAPTPRRA